ncbi:hypothetical protein OAV13_00585 [bacterium]|jgi:hypothetical protein|nr:hypothetical protein [bacterium]
MLDREQMLKALIAHSEGQIAKHQMNVEVYLANPAGIGEHQDVFEAMEMEVIEMSKYHDIIEMVETYLE